MEVRYASSTPGFLPRSDIRGERLVELEADCFRFRNASATAVGGATSGPGVIHVETRLVIPVIPFSEELQ